mgnify:CR=1 FL=1
MFFSDRLKLKNGGVLLALLVSANFSLVSFHVHPDTHCCPTQSVGISDYHAEATSHGCVICQAVRVLGSAIPAGSVVLQPDQSVHPFTADTVEQFILTDRFSSSGRSPPAFL